MPRRHTPGRMRHTLPPRRHTLPHAAPRGATATASAPWQVRPAPPPPPPAAEFARLLRRGVALELLLNDAWWPVRYVTSRRAAHTAPRRAAAEHLVASELYLTEFWVRQARLRPSSVEALPPPPPLPTTAPPPSLTPPTPTPAPRAPRAPPVLPATLPAAFVKPPTPHTKPQAPASSRPASKPAAATPQGRPKARAATAEVTLAARSKVPSAAPPPAAPPPAASQLFAAARPPATKPAAAKPAAANPATAKKRGHVCTAIKPGGARVDRSLRLQEDGICDSCGGIWPKGSISYNGLGTYRSRCRLHGEACVERPVYKKLLKGLPGTR